MRATDIIMKKRGTNARGKDGKKFIATKTELSPEEIKFIIDGYTNGKIPDYQMSSFLMAVYFNGMTFEETGVLTDCMLHSGDVIELHGMEKDGLTGPFIDKHSTGGVGDKISLPLAPIVACCGVQERTRSRSHRRHPGQTGIHRRIQCQLESGRIPQGNCKRRLCHDGPDSCNRSGRQKNVRPARRYCHS